MKMQLRQFGSLLTFGKSLKMFSTGSVKLLALLLLVFLGKETTAQTVFNETFSNLTTVSYSTAIAPANFNTLFDNSGWTSSSSSGQSVAEAGSLCIGRSGSSGGNLSTPAMDLSGTDIVILSFKVKFYGTNSITGSTSSKVIVQLDGAKSLSGNDLNWKVNCTSTSITMQIERSVDGTNFKTINSITASQARCGQPFNFMDAQPVAGTNYYRLKMIDVDGKISYSAIVAILNKIKGTEINGLYPTIIRDEASLSLVTAKATSINTIITDMNGKLIKANTRSIAEGSSLIKIDCSALANGVYNLTSIVDGKIIKTIRFVKL